MDRQMTACEQKQHCHLIKTASLYYTWSTGYDACSRNLDNKKQNKEQRDGKSVRWIEMV